MNGSSASPGAKVAAAAGAALLIFMFLPWYGAEAKGGARTSTDTDVTAWEAFSFIDILLLLVAVVAVALVIAQALGSVPATPVPPGVIVHLAGALAVVLVLFRLIDTPGDLESLGGADIDVTRKIGAFLGLLAAIGITVGGRLAIPAGVRRGRARAAGVP